MEEEKEEEEEREAEGEGGCGATAGERRGSRNGSGWGKVGSVRVGRGGGEGACHDALATQADPS